MGLIEPHDEEVLAHMTNVTVSPRADGFTLHFYFAENQFFTNEVVFCFKVLDKLNFAVQVLTKDYTYREGPNPKSPLTYEGPEIVATKGL